MKTQKEAKFPLADSIVKEYIRKLRNNEISLLRIPDEYKNDPKIVKYERAVGMRITGRRGFDIITNRFFVEEELVYTDAAGKERRSRTVTHFDSFKDYYIFLDGEIYENACYRFHHISKEELSSFGTTPERLSAKKSFIDYTIKDYTFLPTPEEIEHYKVAEHTHKQCKKWLVKYNSCVSGADLLRVTNNYQKSALHDIVDESFFFFNYLYSNPRDNKRLDAVLEFISTRTYPSIRLIYGLCLLCSPATVWQEYSKGFSSKGTTYYRSKNRFDEYVQLLNTREIRYSTRAYFDKNTHFFCEEKLGKRKDGAIIENAVIRRYFDTFDDFVQYRNGDLTWCDFSAAIYLEKDFSKYWTNSSTKLPPPIHQNLSYTIKKYYWDKDFVVVQRWTDDNNSILKVYQHTFEYFFDFVAFLQGDLSDADLLYCDGLAFLTQWDGIDFSGAKLRSNLCKKFGVHFDEYYIDKNLVGTFEKIEKNEIESSLAVLQCKSLSEQESHNSLTLLGKANDGDWQRVDYVSDLHLIHRLIAEHCLSDADVECVIKKIVDTISIEAKSIILIGGDISSDFSLFVRFVQRLSSGLKRRKLPWGKVDVIFILGNHELWPFPGLSLSNIVEKYRSVLAEYGMILLQNDLLFLDDCTDSDCPQTKLRILRQNELYELTDEQIAEKMRYAKFAVLGGIGFSGYNEEFNAKQGIYLKTIDRATEICETNAFEQLYERFSPLLKKKNAIILSHMPKKDWCKNSEPDEDLVYISGHTHRNYFYDDGAIRVYSDNQIGYHGKSVSLKYLLLDSGYDCFEDYSDGIYEISQKQYIDFYRGKNISMTLRRPMNQIFMLKRNGYYCFLHVGKNGAICILNGGSYKDIKSNSVSSCYAKMDAMIARIKNPLEQYTAVQKTISSAIVKIGGSGTIHGCIVDIDFFNHIFVNPTDLTATGYWASDIVNKVVYPSIPELLKAKCPQLYLEYTNLSDQEQSKMLVPRQPSELARGPAYYFDTDIYRASREIKKMQKLNNHILSAWYDDYLHEEQKNGVNGEEISLPPPL